MIREKVKNFARVSVNNASDGAPPYKIIVLDEADSLTADAQSALRRIIENYSKVTRFCLICNYVSRYRTSNRIVSAYSIILFLCSLFD